MATPAEPQAGAPEKEQPAVVAATLSPDAPAAARHDNTVDLASVDPATRKILQAFDRDGNGEVDVSELGALVNELVKTQFTGRLFLWGLVSLVFCLLLLLGIGCGLTWAVVMANKDTEVDNGVWYVRGTEDMVQIANTDITVDASGNVATRGSVPLVTAASLLSRALTANMTSDALKSLVSITITSETGSQLGFKVSGWSALPGNPAVLHIKTPGGVLVVRGAAVDPASVPVTMLSDAAAQAWPVITGLFSS